MLVTGLLQRNLGKWAIITLSSRVLYGTITETPEAEKDVSGDHYLDDPDWPPKTGTKQYFDPNCVQGIEIYQNAS